MHASLFFCLFFCQLYRGGLRLFVADGKTGVHVRAFFAGKPGFCRGGFQVHQWRLEPKPARQGSNVSDWSDINAHFAASTGSSFPLA